MDTNTKQLISKVNSNLFRLCNDEDEFYELIILCSKLMKDCQLAIDTIADHKSEGLETLILPADEHTLEEIHTLLIELGKLKKY